MLQPPGAAPAAKQVMGRVAPVGHPPTEWPWLHWCQACSVLLLPASDDCLAYISHMSQPIWPDGQPSAQPAHGLPHQSPAWWQSLQLCKHAMPPILKCSRCRWARHLKASSSAPARVHVNAVAHCRYNECTSPVCCRITSKCLLSTCSAACAARGHHPSS
jgi:hypothetical protein